MDDNMLLVRLHQLETAVVDALKDHGAIQQMQQALSALGAEVAAGVTVARDLAELRARMEILERVLMDDLTARQKLSTATALTQVEGR